MTIHNTIIKTKKKLTLTHMKQKTQKPQQSIQRLPPPKSEEAFEGLHFWRKGNGEDDYALMFSYGASIGKVIMQGLSPSCSWIVKDDSGKVVKQYDNGGS